MPFDPPTGDIGRTKKTSAAGGVPGQAGAEGEDGEDEASPSRDVSPTGEPWPQPLTGRAVRAV